jgi:hypothetical protein
MAAAYAAMMTSDCRGTTALQTEMENGNDNNIKTPIQ